MVRLFDARSLASIARPRRLVRYLVGLLLSPMPDEDICEGAETSASAVYRRLFEPKKRCARAARLPAVVETPLGRRSRDAARPISGRRDPPSKPDIPLDESVLRSASGKRTRTKGFYSFVFI